MEEEVRQQRVRATSFVHSVKDDGAMMARKPPLPVARSTSQGFGFCFFEGLGSLARERLGGGAGQTLCTRLLARGQLG